MNEPARSRVAVVLRGNAWFASLPADLQDGVLGRAHVRAFAKGQVVQIEDSPTGAGLGVVLAGSVQVLRYANDDEEPALIHVGWTGFWFGEMVCLDTGIPAVSIVARSDVRILFLPKADFQVMAAADARYFRAVSQMVFRRYRLIVRFLAEARELPPDEHLRLRLADLAELRRLDAGPSNGPVDLEISQAELGRLVGLSRQKVNARLQGLQAEGWVVLRQASITVLDATGLRASAMAERPRHPAPASA